MGRQTIYVANCYVINFLFPNHLLMDYIQRPWWIFVQFSVIYPYVISKFSKKNICHKVAELAMSCNGKHKISVSRMCDHLWTQPSEFNSFLWSNEILLHTLSI